MSISDGESGFSRRKLLGTFMGAVGLALIGLERRALADTAPGERFIADYTGSLCYNENPLGPSPGAAEAISEQAAWPIAIPTGTASRSSRLSQPGTAFHRPQCHLRLRRDRSAPAVRHGLQPEWRQCRRAQSLLHPVSDRCPAFRFGGSIRQLEQLIRR